MDIRKKRVNDGTGITEDIDHDHTLYCRTTLPMGGSFRLDLGMKERPCQGANYVCFGYADLVFKPGFDNALEMTPKVVVLDLDMLPWTPPKPEGILLMRYMTTGWLYSNPAKEHQAVQRATGDIGDTVKSVLKDISGNAWRLMNNPETPGLVRVDPGTEEIEEILSGIPAATLSSGGEPGNP